MAYDETDFIQARLTTTEALIASYEEALAAIASGEQQYTLDTGQTRQTVTRANLASIENALAAAYTRRAALREQLYGGSNRHVRPAF